MGGGAWLGARLGSHFSFPLCPASLGPRTRGQLLHGRLSGLTMGLAVLTTWNGFLVELRLRLAPCEALFVSPRRGALIGPFFARHVAPPGCAGVLVSAGASSCVLAGLGPISAIGVVCLRLVRPLSALLVPGSSLSRGCNVARPLWQRGAGDWACSFTCRGRAVGLLLYRHCEVQIARGSLLVDVTPSRAEWAGAGAR